MKSLRHFPIVEREILYLVMVKIMKHVLIFLCVHLCMSAHAHTLFFNNCLSVFYEYFSKSKHKPHYGTAWIAWTYDQYGYLWIFVYHFYVFHLNGETYLGYNVLKENKKYLLIPNPPKYILSVSVPASEREKLSHLEKFVRIVVRWRIQTWLRW